MTETFKMDVHIYLLVLELNKIDDQSNTFNVTMEVSAVLTFSSIEILNFSRKSSIENRKSLDVCTTQATIQNYLCVILSKLI